MNDNGTGTLTLTGSAKRLSTNWSARTGSAKRLSANGNGNRFREARFELLNFLNYMTHMSALNQGVKGGAMRVLMNHIYEYKKGVRRMVLYTFNQKYMKYAEERLEHQGIKYIMVPLGNDRVNLFFGRSECLDVVRMMIDRPLNELTPEEDFMLGAMLGYDISVQCERYCAKRGKLTIDN